MKPSDRVRWFGAIDTLVDQGYASEGTKVDPVSGIIHADTGQLAEGYYDFDVTGVGSGVGFKFYVVHRNGSNTAGKAWWLGSFAVNGMFQLHIKSIKIASNERIRAENSGNLTGTFLCAINWRQRGH